MPDDHRYHSAQVRSLCVLCVADRTCIVDHFANKHCHCEFAWSSVADDSHKELVDDLLVVRLKRSEVTMDGIEYHKQDRFSPHVYRS